MPDMPDSLRRAIRTFIQAFLGAIISSGVLSAINESGVVDWSVLKKVLMSAAAAGVIALITFSINFLEDAGAIPSVLKARASSGRNPVTLDPID